MEIEIGKRVIHKTLGNGIIEPYIDFDGTKTRSNMLKDSGICFIRLDCHEKNCAEVVCVDVESLTEE